MRHDIINTREIISLSKKRKRSLHQELFALYHEAFPKMPEKEKTLFINDFFIDPGKTFIRTAFFFRNKIKKLISAAIFDERIFSYNELKIKGIYSISRAVLPKYQSLGMGKKIASRIFSLNNPTLLFTTCAQSASLHSWLNLWKKEIIKGYDVYPRLCHSGKGQYIESLSVNEFSTICHLFKQIYGGVAGGDKNVIMQAVNNLTPTMVRKAMYASHFNYHPWKKNGRADDFATVLNLTRHDGVLLLFKKRAGDER